MNAAELTERWARTWPDCPPRGHDIRRYDPERWVRFHSLPGSKRSADTAAEYAEILHRHRAVLAALAGADDVPVLVVTVDYGARDLVRPLHLDPDAGLAGAWPWLRLPADDYDAAVDLHVTETSTGAIDAALRVVADGGGDVIVMPGDLAWLYHPYDGGGDVVARSEDERDRLAGRFAAWLAPEYVRGFRR